MVFAYLLFFWNRVLGSTFAYSELRVLLMKPQVAIFAAIFFVVAAAKAARADADPVRWAYMTPPWNFNMHPKYRNKEIQAIPLSEWEQMAAFDSASKCEKARLFARDI